MLRKNYIYISNVYVNLDKILYVDLHEIKYNEWKFTFYFTEGTELIIFGDDNTSYYLESVLSRLQVPGE